MKAILKGQALPSVKVDNKGEVLLEAGKTVYAPWSTDSLQGKVRCIQHLAGRSSAKEINETLMDALKAAEFPQGDYQTTTIVNLKDAVFGTSAIVAMMVEGGKKEFPWSSVVVDAKGDVQKAWQLDKESSAIVIVDRQGDVLFAKDGKLNNDEIREVIQLIEAELAENELLA